MQFLYLEMPITKFSQEQTKATRKTYTHQLRKDFRDRVIRRELEEEDNTGIPEDFDYWQIHHRVPQWAGGTHDFTNLAMTPPLVHNEVHFIIDRQASGMKIGETRLIRIPLRPGYLWDDGPLRARRALKKYRPEEYVYA